MFLKPYERFDVGHVVYCLVAGCALFDRNKVNCSNNSGTINVWKDCASHKLHDFRCLPEWEQEAHQLVGQVKGRATRFRPKAVGMGIFSRF